ncbi:uncharacterized protein LOC111273579 [Varroa jacobsoni]|uniref:uncharacterized protein LOC111273579 n=1 Tax=Varroa jacobsoni TaxID=62625 RepID=UPI000BF8BFBD|nr:uncharacterized protein LOC111273579 [Varroa jacobsoni]
MWALSAAIFSFAALHLHMLNLFDRLSSWHDAQSFTQIKYLALGVCGLSTIGGAVFGALALRMKEEVDFDENNFFISSIAAGLSLLSGLMLLVTAIFYRKHIREASDQQFLTDDQQSPGPPYA